MTVVESLYGQRHCLLVHFSIPAVQEEYGVSTMMGCENSNMPEYPLRTTYRIEYNSLARCQILSHLPVQPVQPVKQRYVHFQLSGLWFYT